jgi:hypothetical protein
MDYLLVIGGVMTRLISLNGRYQKRVLFDSGAGMCNNGNEMTRSLKLNKECRLT